MAAEVKWLLGELGPARDTDVFLAEVLAQWWRECPARAPWSA